MDENFDKSSIFYLEGTEGGLAHWLFGNLIRHLAQIFMRGL